MSNVSGHSGQADELLTLKQVAARLQISTKTVSRLITKHDIPVVKVGSQIRVPARHLQLFVTKTW